MVAGDNGDDGDECKCESSDYAYSEASGLCDSCYFVCIDSSECTVETENCGTINKYEDKYIEICTSSGTEADSESDFLISWNYNSATEDNIVSEDEEGDNMLCDDFITGKCDFFDDVPEDIVSVNHVDIALRGDDGWQVKEFNLYVDQVNIASYSGALEDFECISDQGWLYSPGKMV